MKNFSNFILESFSEDQTQAAENAVCGAFRDAIRLGYLPTADIEMEARRVVFVNEIDSQNIANGLLSIGFKYVSTPGTEEEPPYEGYIKGYTDIITRKSSRMINGTDVSGYEIGIYTDVQDVMDMYEPEDLFDTSEEDYDE